jgi:hypothetical protein
MSKKVAVGKVLRTKLVSLDVGKFVELGFKHIVIIGNAT